MEEQMELNDPALAALERDYAERVANKADDDQFVDVTDDEEETADVLESASALLKNTALLLEYVADPDFCKTLTKRERQNMNKQAEKLFAQADVLDKLVEELQDDTDEDEDDDE